LKLGSWNRFVCCRNVRSNREWIASGADKRHWTFGDRKRPSCYILSDWRNSSAVVFIRQVLGLKLGQGVSSPDPGYTCFPLWSNVNEETLPVKRTWPLHSRWFPVQRT
jgi:hypothetical protein